MIKKTWLSLTLLLAAGFALLAAQPAAAGSFHGVVTQGPLTALDYERMGDGGVGTLRLPIVWRGVEPTRGNRDFGPIEPIIGQAAANGVRVLPTIIGPGPAGTQHPPTNGSSRRAFAGLAGALAGRFGRGGTFWDSQPVDLPFTAYQLLNEQNGPAYWDARPNPKAYGKLVKAAAKKINRKDRRAEIVLGGMFGTPSGDGAKTSWAYLNALYKVKGIKKAFDTAAIHPYSPTLRGIKFQIKKIRRVMKKNRDRGAKLRLTELGWGSANNGNLNEGRSGQAKLLKKSFRLLERKKGVWKIKGATWFAWQDNAAGACTFCPSAGLFEADRDPKPSWTAFQEVAG